MKISIITPCRNSSKTIRRTIESVILQAQSFKQLEYIVVDGLSTDDTCEIVREYQKKYSFIKLISEKDNSMTEALNKGCKLADGDIVASLNADDIYLPETLSKVERYFENNKHVDVLMTNTYFVDDESKLVLSKNMPRYFKPWICALTECPFPECGVFFRRSSLVKAGFFDEEYKYTQDFELYLRMYYQGRKFAYHNIDSSCFFRGVSNYSSTITDKMDAEVVRYFQYGFIFKFFAGSWISKILKILLGIRKYYVCQKFKYTMLMEK